MYLRKHRKLGAASRWQQLPPDVQVRQLVRLQVAVLNVNRQVWSLADVDAGNWVRAVARGCGLLLVYARIFDGIVNFCMELQPSTSAALLDPSLICDAHCWGALRTWTCRSWSWRYFANYEP